MMQRSNGAVLTRMRGSVQGCCRCKDEIKRHLDTIDQLENQNDIMSKELNEEREAHRVTVCIRMRGHCESGVFTDPEAGSDY